jgi:hypothetical protein
MPKAFLPFNNPLNRTIQEMVPVVRFRLGSNFWREGQQEKYKIPGTLYRKVHLLSDGLCPGIGLPPCIAFQVGCGNDSIIKSAFL